MDNKIIGQRLRDLRQGVKLSQMKLSVRFLRFPRQVAKQDFLERGTATAQSCHRF